MRLSIVLEEHKSYIEFVYRQSFCFQIEYYDKLSYFLYENFVFKENTFSSYISKLLINNDTWNFYYFGYYE